MLQAIRNPSRSLAGTPYEHAEASNLWVHGGKLGQAGRLAYQLLAQLAVARGTPEVQASARYLCLKSDGAFDARTFGKMLTELGRAGLVTLINKRTGLRQVHAPTLEEVAALERERQVAGRRQANIAQARRESDDHQDWLAHELSNLSDDDAMSAWDPPAARGPEGEPDAGRRVPRFLENWGGLMSEGG
jgi:hypothetical protein